MSEKHWYRVFIYRLVKQNDTFVRAEDKEIAEIEARKERGIALSNSDYILRAYRVDEHTARGLDAIEGLDKEAAAEGGERSKR